MVTVTVLVVTMDVLKYGFGIDPAKEELDIMQTKKKKAKGKRTIMVIRYLYVHSSVRRDDIDLRLMPPIQAQTGRHSLQISA